MMTHFKSFGNIWSHARGGGTIVPNGLSDGLAEALPASPQRPSHVRGELVKSKICAHPLALGSISFLAPLRHSYLNGDCKWFLDGRPGCGEHPRSEPEPKPACDAFGKSQAPAPAHLHVPRGGRVWRKVSVQLSYPFGRGRCRTRSPPRCPNVG